MSSIKDKIAALLALSTSPEEHEAEAALLKARELMAKHKLKPEDIEEQKDTRIVRKGVNVTCTKKTNAWVMQLANVIARRHCCLTFRITMPKSKTSQVGFVGFADDFELCKRIFLYAYQCVQARCDQIKRAHRRMGYSGGEIREMCNAYGTGFCRGLRAAYDLQDAQHQEWGLVLTVPQSVLDSISDMKKPQPYGELRVDGWRMQYAAAGFAEGKAFDPTRCLAAGEKKAS